MWILWILASSVFLAFYDLAKKASVRENAVLPVLLIATIAGAAAYVAALGMAGGIGAALQVSARVTADLMLFDWTLSLSFTFAFFILPIPGEVQLNGHHPTTCSRYV